MSTSRLAVFAACALALAGSVLAQPPAQPAAKAETKGPSPDREPQRIAAGQQTWPMTLEPYAIRAVQIESPDVRVLDVNARSAPAAQAELDSRLRDFEKRDLTAPRITHAVRRVVARSAR